MKFHADEDFAWQALGAVDDAFAVMLRDTSKAARYMAHAASMTERLAEEASNMLLPSSPNGAISEVAP